MRRWGVHAALGLCVWWLAAGVAAAAELHVRWADGRRAAPLAIERPASDSDEWYVSADALADALALERFWRPEARKLVLKVGNHRIQVTIATRLVLDGDDEVLLREPVLYRRGSVMLPLEFVERILAPRLGEGARFDRAALDLVLGRSAGDVVGIDYEPGTDATRIRIRMSHAFEYRAQATSRQLVRLRFDGAEIDPVALAADRPAPLVRSLRAEQAGTAAILYFELEGSAGFADRSEDGGRTVIIDIQRGAAPAPPPISMHAPSLRALGAAVADSFDVVVLDAGHGGFDRGARVAGLDEPDVTLRMAMALRPILERELGVRVVLTRDGDATLAAASRAEVANRAGADVFVSLHCNTWFDPRAHGFEVLHAPALRSTAADAVLASSRSGVTDFVPWDVAHAPWAEASRRFAADLAAALAQELGSSGRGARGADLEVLQGATMPAAVVELGFLTNADDRAAFESPDFTARVGAALVTAIASLRDAARGATP
jgi:N-acetylmuramoyl-L-alanine amidase